MPNQLIQRSCMRVMDDAVLFIRAHSGLRFDREVVERFNRCLPIVLELRETSREPVSVGM